MNKVNNYIKKLINLSIFIRLKKGVQGKGEIVCDLIDHLIISKSSKITLNGKLYLNTNRMGYNGRSSILRMDDKSTLDVRGDFKFMYGADIILFSKSLLSLGKGSYINSDCKIRCHKEIIIGEYCAISHDFTIMDSDAHSINGHKDIKPVHIGNHVWIGTRVTILKGVTIGNGAIIAAGSVVVNDIPEKCLAAGIPAKVIKENVTWGE